MRRAKTVDEMREEFLDSCRSIVWWWSTETREPDVGQKVSGAVFSMLALLDGCSGEFPAVDLVLRPHPDDKAFRIGEDSDWIEDGMCINSDVMLHELFYKQPVDVPQLTWEYDLEGRWFGSYRRDEEARYRIHIEADGQFIARPRVDGNFAQRADSDSSHSTLQAAKDWCEKEARRGNYA